MKVTQETLAAHLPQYHVIFGDMGSACAFTLCPACTCGLVCDASTCASNTSVGLVSEVEKVRAFFVLVAPAVATVCPMQRCLCSLATVLKSTLRVRCVMKASMMLHVGDFG